MFSALKILQVAGEYYDTVGRGIGGYVYHLSKNLAIIGHKVDVIAYIRGDIRAHAPDVKICDVPMSKIPLWRMSRWGFEAYAKVSRVAENYDVIHAHMPSSCGYPVFHRFRVPLVVTAHTTCFDPTYPQWLRPYYFLEDKLSYRQASCIIAVSKAIVNELVKAGVDPIRIGSIPVGVDTEKFRPSGIHKGTDFFASYNGARAREGNSLVLLCVGTINRRKGVEYLLKSISLLPEIMRKRVEVKIVGAGPLLSYYKNKYSHIQSIQFYGYVSDDLLPLIYSSADIFVYPSLYEGLPTVVLEAMASGLPVIATNIPSIAEVVKSDFGILVKPKSPHAIAQAIAFMARNASIREEMAKRALFYSKKYDWRQIVLRISKIYEQIV
jgi:glycosyltransferase involved in cell wall biosynthesis